MGKVDLFLKNNDILLEVALLKTVKSYQLDVQHWTVILQWGCCTQEQQCLIVQHFTVLWSKIVWALWLPLKFYFTVATEKFIDSLLL